MKCELCATKMYGYGSPIKPFPLNCKIERLNCQYCRFENFLRKRQLALAQISGSANKNFEKKFTNFSYIPLQTAEQVQQVNSLDELPIGPLDFRLARRAVELLAQAAQTALHISET